MLIQVILIGEETPATVVRTLEECLQLMAGLLQRFGFSLALLGWRLVDLNSGGGKRSLQRVENLELRGRVKCGMVPVDVSEYGAVALTRHHPPPAVGSRTHDWLPF